MIQLQEPTTTSLKDKRQHILHLSLSKLKELHRAKVIPKGSYVKLALLTTTSNDKIDCVAMADYLSDDEQPRITINPSDIKKAAAGLEQAELAESSSYIQLEIRWQ